MRRFLQTLFVFIVTVFGGHISQAKDTVHITKHGAGDPVVVFLGGSEGGSPQFTHVRDALLHRGISVAEVAYFKFPNGPRHLQNIDIDEIAQQIAKLSTSRKCTGILGVSKGAELAMLLAAYNPVSEVTVAVVPSHVVWQSPRASLRKTSSWSQSGMPLAFVPYATFSSAAIKSILNYENALPLHVNALADARATGRAAIPVERIEQPVLLQSAQHDQIWPSVQMARHIMDRLNRLNKGHQFVHRRYDHDHYLLNNRQAFSDLVRFFTNKLAYC